MYFKTLVVAVLAATSCAERVPYKLARRSNPLVALVARQQPGYQPEQTFCGHGDTCVEACGAGFEQCPSEDGLSHCYHQSAGEVCCRDAEGNACENGYYCAQNPSGDTWCCPEGMGADECAKAYEVDGGLVSQVPVYPSTATHTPEPPKPTVTDTPAYPTTTWPATTHGGSNGTTVVPTASPTPTIATVPASGAGSLAASGVLAFVAAVAAAAL